MTQGNGFTVSSAPVPVTVDNTTGSVSIGPLPVGGKVKGTESLTATTDANVPITSVRYDAATTGGKTWTCTSNTPPYTCAWDTTKSANGDWTLSAVMTLANGAKFTSSPVTVTVDNIINSLTVNLSTPLKNGKVKGTETLSATTTARRAQRLGPVRRGEVRRRVHGPAPRPRSRHTPVRGTRRRSANGSYTVSAVMTLANGTKITPPTETVRVANLKGVDVQAGNVQAGKGDGTVGAGDTITLAYSSEVDLSTIKSGFTGAATAVSLKSRTGSARADTLTFGSGVNLGQVAFAQDYVRNNHSVTIPATMRAATVGEDTVVSITLGNPNSTFWLSSPDTPAGAMIWTPDAAVLEKDLRGACSTSAVTESGSADADF